MKKVLIVTYYWPPAGGPGVQRILKFAKYLPQFGWQPIILTVHQGEYPAIDESLINEVPTDIKVYKTGSLEPGFLYKKFLGLKNKDKIPVAVLAEKDKNWKKKIANWIRLNFFIPDAKIGWLPAAVSTGKKIIDREKPAIIFSSSPPPTVHLIAQKLKKYSSLNWIADFRDPWTDIHYYEEYKRLWLSERFDSRLEKTVLNVADKIVCVSQYDIEMDFGKKVSTKKCINIANGFDEADFKDIIEAKQSGKIFNLLHLGAVGVERNPVNLFKAIQRMDSEHIISQHDFQLTFVGKVEEVIHDSIKDYGISGYVTLVPYVPHRQALEFSSKATIMLLLITQSQKNIRILPGKTFEYMRTKKPVLSLGPENGEVARILDESNTGRVIDYSKDEEIFRYLKTMYLNWKGNKSFPKLTTHILEKYTRKSLTRQLTTVFNEPNT